MLYLYHNKRTKELKELDFPMGEAPSIISPAEWDGDTWMRVYTAPQVVFYGPDFYSTDNSKTPLKRVPRKQRI